MEKLKEFYKGIFIGISNMVPGLSGATLAIFLGIYDKMIDNIADLAKHPIKVIKNLFFIFLGNIVGILLGFIVIARLLIILFPIEVAFIFAGLVIGGINPIFNNVFKKNEKTGPSNWVGIFIPIILLITLAIINFKNLKETGTQTDIALTFGNFMILFGLGLFSTTSMVLPGVSGSMILMAFGYYLTLTDLVSDVINQLLDFKFTSDIVLLLGFIAGCLIGVVLASKLIKMMLEKHPKLTNSIIFGLLLGSFVSICIIGILTYIYTDVAAVTFFDQEVYAMAFNHKLLPLHIVIGVIAMGFGFQLGRLLIKTERVNLDFASLSHQYYKKALDELKELVKIPSVLDEYNPNSVEPFGHQNKLALDYTLNLGKKLGFDIINDNNYAGMISFGKGDQSLGVLAHLDVVPAVGNWTYGPFNPVEADGKLYGRGTLDDKCGVIAALFAMKLLKDNGFKPKKKIELICGCDEESGSRCLEHYFQNYKKPEMAFSPDATFPLIYGEKAILSYDISFNKVHEDVISFECGLRYNIVIDEAKLEVKKLYEKEFKAFLKENNIEGEIVDSTYIFKGKGAHASTPEQGINAGIYMLRFMDKYYPSEISKFSNLYNDIDGKLLGIDQEDPEMGKMTMNLGIISFKDKKLGYNLRVPTDNHVLKIKERLEEVLKDYPDLKLINFDFAKAHYVPKDSLLVTKLMEAYQESTGDYENEPQVIGGGTYAKIIDQAVAFGPCFPYREDICHEPDEHIYLDDFVKWIEIYARSIYLLAK